MTSLMTSDMTTHRHTALIDTHCHLDFDIFDEDRAAVIERARGQGISHIIIPGTRRIHWPRITELCRTHAHCLPCYGLHPYWADEHQQSDIDALATYIDKNPVTAIGECGLDYRPGQADKNIQRGFFEDQLVLAADHGLPVVIHSVRATEDIIRSIKTLNANKDLSGMIHSFSGSLEQAQQLIELNFFISVGGSITFENAKKLRRVVEGLPLSALLLETDAPDQLPDNHVETQRNEPAFMVDALDAVAQIRQETIEEIGRQTTENARKLFSIPA